MQRPWAEELHGGKRGSECGQLEWCELGRGGASGGGAGAGAAEGVGVQLREGPVSPGRGFGCCFQ